MQFIYVMSEDARDKLLEMGYKLIWLSKANMIWVFENKEPGNLELTFDFPHVFSNTMIYPATDGQTQRKEVNR